ncbi:hypothetical protein LLEC1_06714, partial [Akanthomyces lecanii]
EEVCWECWTVKVTVAEPRTESGESFPQRKTLRAHNHLLRKRGKRGTGTESQANRLLQERAKVRRAMEQTLLTTAMKIVTFANTHKDHIPPITTQGGNPFPCKISIEQKESTGWAARMRIY